MFKRVKSDLKLDQVRMNFGSKHNTNKQTKIICTFYNALYVDSVDHIEIFQIGS